MQASTDVNKDIRHRYCSVLAMDSRLRWHYDWASSSHHNAVCTVVSLKPKPSCLLPKKRPRTRVRLGRVHSLVRKTCSIPSFENATFCIWSSLRSSYSSLDNRSFHFTHECIIMPNQERKQRWHRQVKLILLQPTVLFRHYSRTRNKNSRCVRYLKRGLILVFVIQSCKVRRPGC
jgi:hypothetical protein